MPRSPDLAVFVLTIDNDRRQTKPITLPLAHARGVKTCKVIVLGNSGASGHGVEEEASSSSQTNGPVSPSSYM